jgi:hypothetical protein
VWIPPKSISELSGVPEPDIRQALGRHKSLEAGVTDVIVALRTVDECKALVADLRKWTGIAKAKAQSTSGS